MKSRRGVSEIVASLIVLLIVSVLGVMLYNLSVNTMGSQQDALNFDTSLSKTIAQQRFEIITATRVVQNSQPYLNVTIYNYGQVDVKIVDFYLETSTGISHPQFSPSPYLISHNGNLLQSDISFFMVNISDIQQPITSCKIVSAEGVTNEIQVAL
jgi:flagellin-like protein